MNDASAIIPERRSLKALREASAGCRACPPVHPSAILRAPDDRARRAERERFTEDLRVAAQALG